MASSSLSAPASRPNPGARPRACLATILAAGEGKRMRSALPKAMHPIAGRPMLLHAMAVAREAGATAIAVVIGPGHEALAKAARAYDPGCQIFLQETRRGTAHAALAARAALADGYDDALVMFADTPLLQAESLLAIRAALADGAAVVALGFEAEDPHGYGRLLVQDGRLLAIREERDASAIERAVRLCNAGVMGLAGDQALSLLEAVDDDNAQNEFYLTQAVEIAVGRGLDVRPATGSAEEAMGVNDRVQLAAAERAIQRRLRRAAMLAGASLIDPETVQLSFDTELAADVTVEPHVVFGLGARVGPGAVIRAFSHLEGCEIEAGAHVGPFARLRPGAKIGAGAKIGNFVEIKNANVGREAKVSHLAYLGDADVGAGANVGAGVITCNYDGFLKYRTQIGAAAFIGSNASLVAPVRIGAGAYVGSGTVVMRDVPDDALELARPRPVGKAGWAKAFRARKLAEKAARSPK